MIIVLTKFAGFTLTEVRNLTPRQTYKYVENTSDTWSWLFKTMFGDKKKRPKLYDNKGNLVNQTVGDAKEAEKAVSLINALSNPK